MRNIIIILIAVTATTLSSCFKGDYDDPPTYSDANLQVTTSIHDLKKWFATDNFSSSPKEVTEDWIIEGIVTSSDESGNIYKQLFIQDETGGICISIDMNNTYALYPQGRKIYVKLKGLTLGTYGGLVQIGYEIDEQYSPAGVFRLPTTIIDDHIFYGSYEGLPEPIAIPDFSLLSDSLQSMYVSLQDVELPDGQLGETYADAVAQVSKNRTLGNCAGQTIILRNSGYASFAGIQMPKGNGAANGIFTVYNGDLQFLISDTSALSDLSRIRCDGTDPNAVYLLDENFETAVTNATIDGFNGWSVVMEEGNKEWVGGSYGGTKFAKISAFSSGQPSVTSWLISPMVDLTGISSSTLTFRTLEGYDNGAQLLVKYSTDYTGDGQPQNATWTDLSADIAAGTTSGFNPNWTPSGDVDLSSIGTQIYIAWIYVGGDPGKTTNFELDNVKITGE